MKDDIEAKAIALASLLKGLSLLENEVYELYKTLGDKVDLPFAKSLFLTIAIDSHKHSTILKGVGESIAKSKAKPKECEEKLHAIYSITESFHKEIASKKVFTAEELPQLAQRLTVLEGMLGEEYFVFVQMKTLGFMVKQINSLYNVDLGHLKDIFSEIISDEEHHRELLEIIRGLLEKTAQQTIDSVEVGTQSSDLWTMPTPPASWNQH